MLNMNEESQNFMVICEKLSQYTDRFFFIQKLSLCFRHLFSRKIVKYVVNNLNNRELPYFLQSVLQERFSLYKLSF